MPLALFKYPGGKSKLIPQLREFIDPLALKTETYHEVFVGGGPVLLDIAADPNFNRVYLSVNDLDQTVAAFWGLISLGSDEEFAKLIELVSVKPTIELFWREREKEKRWRNQLTNAYHCVLFHKTTFNGMYHALPIGGKSQSGKWRVDSHYNPLRLISKLREARARVLNRLHVFNIDAVEYIKSIPNHHMMYLDPPYYTTGNSLYPVKMTHESHAALANILRKRKNWVLSYDDCEEVRALYRFANIHEIEAWYSSTSFNGSGKCARKYELVITP